MISQQQQIRWEVLLNQELDLKAFFNKQFRSEIKDPRYGKLKSMFNFLYEWKRVFNVFDSSKVLRGARSNRSIHHNFEHLHDLKNSKDQISKKRTVLPSESYSISHMC